MYCTSNDQGLEEFEIVYQNGLFRDLFAMPMKKESFVQVESDWRTKGTLQKVSYEKELMINNYIRRINAQQWTI
jgi:hypothetical protein